MATWLGAWLPDNWWVPSVQRVVGAVWRDCDPAGRLQGPADSEDRRDLHICAPVPGGFIPIQVISPSPPARVRARTHARSQVDISGVRMSSNGECNTLSNFDSLIQPWLNRRYSFRGWVYLILIGFAILFAAVSAIAQKVLHLRFLSPDTND